MYRYVLKVAKCEMSWDTPQKGLTKVHFALEIRIEKWMQLCKTRLRKFYIRDHSSITSASFWQKLPFSNPTPTSLLTQYLNGPLPNIYCKYLTTVANRSRRFFINPPSIFAGSVQIGGNLQTEKLKIATLILIWGKTLVILMGFTNASRHCLLMKGLYS